MARTPWLLGVALVGYGIYHFTMIPSATLPGAAESSSRLSKAVVEEDLGTGTERIVKKLLQHESRIVIFSKVRNLILL